MRIATVGLMAMLWGSSLAWAVEPIAIRVDAPLPDAGVAPVTFGVPFPKDALPLSEVAAVRVLDDRGVVVPHQRQVTATWSPGGDRGVRWLLIDMQVHPGRSYAIHSDAAQHQEPALEPIAQVKGDEIHLNTGLYQGVVATRGFDLFKRLQFRGQPVTDPDAPFGSAGYVDHETRGRFRSDRNPDAVVTLEESGPLRATLKADGWYTGVQQPGQKFCRYSMRFHFFRDRPEVKVEHTFIYTGQSAEDRIAAIGFLVQRHPVEGGRRVLTLAGNDDLVSGYAVTNNNHVVQLASERDRLDFFTPGEDGGKPMKCADRGGGWMIGEGAFSVAIRDAWQQYPWGLKFDRGAVDVQFWPREAGLLDTSWDGYWSDLTDRQKRFMTGDMDRPAKMDVDQWMVKLRQATRATGAAKTHEFWFSPLSDGNLPRRVAFPTLACADPAWMCRTRALDLVPHVSGDDPRFRDEQIVQRQMLALMQEAVAANHWHGWWDWGGYHQSLNPDGPVLPRFGLWADDAGLEKWHRARPKSHYQWGRYPWVQFMRTGDRDWLRYAQTFTLYSADRAHCHHTGEGRHDGSEYHYDNSAVHWMGGYRKYPGGDALWIPLQSKDDYIYAYWLTGSRRALDVLQANGRLLLASEDPIGFKPGFERGNDIRNAGMMLERVMMLYQATWDDGYRRLADRIAALFLPLTTAQKVRDAEFDQHSGGQFHQASTWAYQGMWFYDQIVGDPAFRAVLQLFIERNRDVAAGFVSAYPAGQSGAPRALTYGYLLTGDTTYLDLARPTWDEFVGRGVSRLQFSPGGKQEISGLPALLGAMAEAPQAWQDAHLPTHQRGSVLTWRAATRNGDPYQPAARAFFRETRDQAWSFTLASNSGGTFTLHRPDGQVQQTITLDAPVKNWQTVTVPSDGLTGDYTLACTAVDSKAPSNFERQARLVGCPLPVAIQCDPSGRDPGVWGRAYCFVRSSKDVAARLEISPLDARRHLILSNGSGQELASTRGRMPLLHDTVALTVPAAADEGPLVLTASLDPERCYRAIERLRLWTLEGIMPFITSTPEAHFVPVIPPGVAAQAASGRP